VLTQLGGTQVPFLRKFAEEKGYSIDSHVYTANAGPWFLYETLLESPQRVLDSQNAEIIYVHGNIRPSSTKSLSTHPPLPKESACQGKSFSEVIPLNPESALWAPSGSLRLCDLCVGI
jgi:hypothetical protein